MPAYIDPSQVMVVSGWLGALVALLLSFGALLLSLFGRSRRWLQRHWRPVLIIGLVLAAAGVCALFIPAKQANAMPSAADHRLIVLGLDGLSPELLEPLMAEGQLPNFARLKAMGEYRRLRTTNPPQSPVAWTTFATGLNPGEHGLYDFIRRQPGSYRPDLALTRLESGKSVPVRHGKAFWEDSVETGVPVCILGCPVSFPPDKVNGRLLSGMGVPDMLGTQGTFAYYTTAAETVTGDTGGDVQVVARANPLKLELLGPYKQGLLGGQERLRVPFEVQVSDDRQRATLRLQGQTFALAVGDWSAWQPVAFKLGAFQAMAGITRFHLAALDPDLKLYVSPISHDPRRPWFPVSSPKDYSRQLADELGLFDTRGMPFDTWGLNEGRLTDDAFIAQAQALLAEREHMLTYEIKRCERGVLFCYFEYPDVIQHMYWRFHDDRHPLWKADAPARLKDMIPDAYRRMDRLVGQALAALREGDTLIVLSDHGFVSFRRALHLNAWLREHGYLVLKDGVTTGGPLFADVDWSKTRAYALGFGGIYLNIKGREPQGLVAEGQATALAAEIAAQLATWTDPAEPQQRVLHRVYRRDEIFRGPYAAQAPDLYIGAAAGYRVSWQTAIGAAPGPLLEDNLKPWSGDHLVDPELVPGILFSSRALFADGVAIGDVAGVIRRLMRP